MLFNLKSDYKMTKIKHIPELIYLQATKDELEDVENDFDNLNAEYTTWSKDRINDTDIEYRRNDARKMIGLLYPDDYMCKQRIKLIAKSLDKKTKIKVRQIFNNTIENMCELDAIFNQKLERGELDLAELNTIAGLIEELYKDMFGKSYYDTYFANKTE